MCYNGSMERIDVLKGIEQILVQKAYETGHISHRKDGDWQKTNNGWVRVKGNPTQPTSKKPDQITLPNARKLTSNEIQELQQISDINERRKRQSEMLSQPTPVENTEYSEIVQQDFESVPSSIKDKMFTIAQQYKSEWAEDGDEDIRSMAEDDVEAISQMLWDNADEETRNSWLDSDEEDLKEYDGTNDLNGLNNGWNDESIEYEVGVDLNKEIADMEDVKTYVEEYFPKLNSKDKEQAMKIVADRAVNLAWLRNDDDEEDLEESYGDDEVDYTYAKDIDYSQYDDDIKSIEFRENDDGEFEPHDDDYFRVADKIYEQTNHEDMSDEEVDQLYDGIVDRVIDRAYELRNNVQKSAIRDMKSTPTTKNMGF